MAKRFSVLILSIVLMFATSGCNVTQELSGAYNMINCKYSYNSISALKVSDMDLSRGVTLTQLPMITSILSGKSSSIPVNFDLNVDIKNPNETAAMLHGLQYIISIDGIQFTSGTVNQSMNIAGGQSQMLPISVGLDIASLLKGDSKDAVMDIAKNFIGIGDKESKVNLQLKPTFMIGNTPVTSPTYLPVNFSFGGQR